MWRSATVKKKRNGEYEEYETRNLFVSKIRLIFHQRSIKGPIIKYLSALKKYSVHEYVFGAEKFTVFMEN